MPTLTYTLCLLLLAGTEQQQSTKTGANCGNVARSDAQEVVELKDELPARRLAGVVASPSGPAIPGVAVEIVDSKERCLRTATTDDDGKFDLKVTKPGRYRLRLSKLGFNTVVAVVRVRLKTKSQQVRLELPMSN